MDCAWTRATVTWTESFLRRLSVPFWRPFLHSNNADKLERKKIIILTRVLQHDYWICKTRKFISSDVKREFYAWWCNNYFCKIISKSFRAIRRHWEKCQRCEVWTVTADILTNYNKRRASAVWFINVSCISSWAYKEYMSSLTLFLLLPQLKKTLLLN